MHTRKPCRGHRFRWPSRLLPAALVCLLAAICAVWVLRSEADAAPRADLEQRVADAVALLDSNSRAERAAAENELLKMGTDALPHLPAPELLKTPAAREAVRRIRVQLEREKALASVGPSRVRVSTQASVGEVIKTIETQTGNRIVASGVPAAAFEVPVQVNYENQEFWRALDDLAGRSQLTYAIGPRSITLFEASAQPPAEVAHSYAGAFRLSVLGAELRPLVGDEKHRLLRMTFRAAAEPRLRPLFITFSPADLSVRAAGSDLQPFNPKAKYELPLGEGGSRIRLQFDTLAPAAQRIERVDFAGSLSMTVAAGEERFEFDLGQVSGLEQRLGGVTVRLELPEQAGEGAGRRVRAIVSYEAGGPAFESHRTWIFHNRAFLENADGTRVQPSDFSTVQQSGGGVAVEYKFPEAEPAEAWRFVYLAPTLIVDAPVRFSFENVAVAR